MPPVKTLRDLEVILAHNPVKKDDARLAFIGILRSNWCLDDCPKNLTQARESTKGQGVIEIAPEYRAGLTGLKSGMKIWILLWFDKARRDIILQAPGHANGLRGAFALRSPVRPNPISIQAVKITTIDKASGVIGIDATDAFDGTPVVDIKPWMHGLDTPSME
jgi:tRNA-Thr(GGU) m(6)t(6)A37 methyltransferase TsaA